MATVTKTKTLRIYEKDIKAFSRLCKINSLTQAKGMEYLLKTQRQYIKLIKNGA